MWHFFVSLKPFDVLLISFDSTMGKSLILEPGCTRHLSSLLQEQNYSIVGKNVGKKLIFHVSLFLFVLKISKQISDK